MRICCHLCSRRRFANSISGLPSLDLWVVLRYSLRLRCWWLVVQTDCGFEGWRNLRRIEGRSAVVLGKCHAAEDMVVGWYMMVSEVWQIVLDLLSESLRM
jgi:hypothetical protein